MGILANVGRRFFGGPWRGTAALDGVDWDLPLQEASYTAPPPALPAPEPPPLPTAIARVEEATAATAARAADLKESMVGLSGTFGIDPDDGLYRRLTDGAKFGRRDLSPIQQDRMLEVTNYLWEQNPFARRLVTLMTDLIVGDGVEVVANDEQTQIQIDKTWTHPSNHLGQRVRSFANFLSLTGELILPCTVNPVTGRPVLGFIDPYQVKAVHPDPLNILVPDVIELKPKGGIGQGERFRVIRVNPATDRLEGDAFFFRINNLPNSLRGRSDLLPLADWLDLYDQYMFAEVERLQLLSSFLWDYEVEGADQATINAKVAAFPVPKPGTVFGHNHKEKLEARTPSLQAADRSEVARLLRLHIAGSMGFPLSYLGDIDSNNATIQGQNDVMMKTPAARQKELAVILGTVAEFTIQSTRLKNPALFNRGDKATSFTVQMPEIQAKDLARAGQVLSQVVGANDMAMANGTLDRRTAIAIQTSMAGHLGLKLDAKVIEKAADAEREEREKKADEIQAGMAAAAAAARRNGGNPPPASGDDDDADEPAA